MTQVQFSETFHMFLYEGHLAHACLCDGLTSLRAAKPDDRKGKYYSAFFNLSVEFERLFKIILIINHMAKNNQLLLSPQLCWGD